MKFGRSDYNKRIIDTAGKIPEDEPCFLLRANDSLAPRMLLNWAMELRLAGGDPNMAREAEDHAQAMIQWQKSHGAKTPDMYKDDPTKVLIKEQIERLISTNKIDLKELTRLLGLYYDSDGNEFVLIVLPSDLSQPLMNSDGTYNIDYQWIESHLSLDDQIRLRKAKIALVALSTNDIRCFKCRI